jgi:hypothetical protein
LLVGRKLVGGASRKKYGKVCRMCFGGSPICLFPRKALWVCLLILGIPLPTPRALAQEQPPGPATTAKNAPSALQTPPTAPDLPAEVSGNQQVAAESPSEAGKNQDAAQPAQSPPLPTASTCIVSGTITDVNGSIVPGANVVLEGAQREDRRTTIADQTGAFQFYGLKAGIPYQVTIVAEGLEDWKSPTILLEPGRYFLLTDIKLKVSRLVTSVRVYADQEQIATEQVQIAEKQRIFGVIPNFYVTYDPNPVPLTTKLKYKLALKADTDVMTFVGVAFMSALYQAGDIPNYGQGWDAYGKRVAAGYADTTSDIFLGGAILPSLLHQDPRYFYQGAGTTKSRMIHALSSPFICRGDNGKNQVNFSSMGGDLASGALSNLYYPQSDRGPGLVFLGFGVTTGVRAVNAVLQEFVLRKLSPSARSKH